MAASDTAQIEISDDSVSGIVPKGDYKRSEGVAGIDELIQQYGGDAARLMAKAGLAPDAFENPNRYLPYDKIIALLEHCARDLEAPHFGFELGCMQTVNRMGVLAALVSAAPSIGNALELLERYIFVHAPGGAAKVIVDRDIVQLTYRVLNPQTAFSRQNNEHAMAYALRLVQLAAGADFRPEFVTIASPTPRRGYQALEAVFEAPVYYEQGVNALAFPTELLSKKIASHDPELISKIGREYDKNDKYRSYIVGIVTELIVTYLPLGDCKIGFVANQIGISPRTLQKLLNKSGKDFRSILLECRAGLAVSYLRNTDIPISEIAILLGYSDQAAFTRAFRSYKGIAPNKYRKSA